MTGRSPGGGRRTTAVARRRPKRNPAFEHAVVLPWWKRLLAALAFTGGGGAFAAWGVHDLAAWIGALRHGAAIIETESALLGLMPMGASIAAIGFCFLFPAAWTERHERSLTIAIGAVFIVMIAGLLLTFFGGLAVTGTMRVRGYRDCETHYGNRMSFTKWAAAGVPCPLKTDDR